MGRLPVCVLDLEPAFGNTETWTSRRSWLAWALMVAVAISRSAARPPPMKSSGSLTNERKVPDGGCAAADCGEVASRAAIRTRPSTTRSVAGLRCQGTGRRFLCADKARRETVADRVDGRAGAGTGDDLRIEVGQVSRTCVLIRAAHVTPRQHVPDQGTRSKKA
jgi:hypothetical protein